jgi:hypothetical protein
MRKLALITALLLASAAAQASESRGLMLAANDTPAANAAAAQAPATPSVTTDAPKPQADAGPAKPAVAKPARHTSARRHESDEAKARRIAARYGVYW